MEGAPMAKPAAKHYKLMRDDARPIEFDGVEVAAAELQPMDDTRTRAAVYQTAGGKFVAEYTKWSYNRSAEPQRWDVERAKVASCTSLEDAAEWFRPGPITTMLLQKLQEQLKGERID
jgi:hypothetical protein